MLMESMTAGLSAAVMQIVTNNPDICWSPDMPYGVVHVEGSPIDVLDRTEELLQENWKLRSAPLPPNLPLMRGPYRSLVIEESEKQYDSVGIIAIEKARTRYVMERQKFCHPEGPDFAAIDRTMLQRTLRDISLLDNA